MPSMNCVQHRRLNAVAVRGHGRGVRSSTRPARLGVCHAKRIGLVPEEDLIPDDLPEGLTPPESMFGLTSSQMMAMGLAGQDVERLQKHFTPVRCWHADRLHRTLRSACHALLPIATSHAAPACSGGEHACLAVAGPARQSTPPRVQEALRASHHYVPQHSKITAGPHQPTTMRAGSYAAGPRGPSTPPPDLPSLLLDRRIVYIGMPLVASVTELIVSELLWLQYADPQKQIFMYINSIGSQQDDQAIGFETEAYAIQDTMNVRPPPEAHTAESPAWPHAWHVAMPCACAPD